MIGNASSFNSGFTTRIVYLHEKVCQYMLFSDFLGTNGCH